MFEARDGADLVVASFTHIELCSIVTHYREHCDLDGVRQLIGLKKRDLPNVN